VRSWFGGLATVAAAMVGLLLLLIIGAAEDDAGPGLTGVDPAKIPALAKQMLPVIDDVVSRQCPELPPVWVVAEIMAESGWNPRAHSNDSNGGASGLYQINDRNWATAGGKPGSGDVFVPETHLRLGIPWVCANLRAVTGHLKATGKPTTPLDAMLVCHIAGCGRVTGSATGVPKAGEAGCGGTCVGLINRYLSNVHKFVDRFGAPVGPPPGPPPEEVLAAPAVLPGGPAGPAEAAAAEPAAIGEPGGVGAVVTVGGITTQALPPAPAAFSGAKTGCTQDDPTTGGCLTAATLYGLQAQGAAFGGFQSGPSITKASCWDRHAWNPTSDHAKGRACDLFPGPAGVFAKGSTLEQGWRVANWYRTNASALRVRYLIWQGRYWDPSTKDQRGWGTRYTGGGIYNVKDATGGHYDHVHVSFTD
jgi:hypothetical protein